MLDRFMVVDDHPLYCDALKLALFEINPKVLVTCVSTLTDAHVKLDQGETPELVYMDLMLPDSDGVASVSTMRKRLPDAKFIVVSAREEPGVVRAVQAAGANAFFGKSMPMKDIIRLTRRVIWGEAAFPDFSTSDAKTRRQVDLIAGLSNAQVRILAELASGRLNKQIAYDLNLAEATVKSHLTSIYKKLGVSNRTQAILVAQQLLPEQIVNTG